MILVSDLWLLPLRSESVSSLIGPLIFQYCKLQDDKNQEKTTVVIHITKKRGPFLGIPFHAPADIVTEGGGGWLDWGSVGINAFL